MNPKYGALSSSVDPSQLSKTVESAIKIVGGGLVLLGVVSNTEIQALIGQVGTVVPAVYVIWNFAEMVFGLLRKVVAHFATR